MGNRRDHDLETALLVPVPLLARVQGIGAAAILSAAERAGVTPTRLCNGRTVVSFASARAIVAELVRPRKATPAS